MSEPVTTVILPSEANLKPLATAHEPISNQLRARISELHAMPLSLQTAKIAQEFDSDAKKYLDNLDKSELAARIGDAFRLHRSLTAWMNTLREPAKLLRSACSSVFTNWDRKLKDDAAEERRKREAAAREEQDRQRIEQAAHLEELGHKDAAEALLNEEPPPISLPEEKMPEGKVQGVSTIQVWVLDEQKPLLDGKAFFAWLADNPAFHGFMDFRYGNFKTALTANEGNLKIPGLNIISKTETRNRR